MANLPVAMDDQQLLHLKGSGIKAVRLNFARGGIELDSNIVSFINKLYVEFEFKIEAYIANDCLRDRIHIFRQFPVSSIDHLGLKKDGLKTLYNLVEKGHRVKATGFGRLDFDPIPVMKQIYRINPEALMFGTDLPSTRAKRPFSWNDLTMIQTSFNTKALSKILCSNAINWYFGNGEY